MVTVPYPLNNQHMPARRNNNKNEGATNGAAGQTNQLGIPGERAHPATDHQQREEGRRVELNVDMTPYILSVTPFNFNNEVRYHVSYNGSPEILFAWDKTVGHFAAFGDDAATMPDSLELAIAERLQQMMKKDLA
jgi:hypothetical protein